MAGSSYDIVILSSSPPAAELHVPSSPLNAHHSSSPRRVAMRASPVLIPSAPVSPQKRPSGASALASRKAPIPPEATRGFATVGSLVRSEHFVQQLDNNLSKKPRTQSPRGSLDEVIEVTAPKKKPRKRSVADSDAKPKPKPRARKAKANSDKPARDPELRLPAPKISPYFPGENAEAPIEPPIESADAASKLMKSGKPRKPRAKKEKTGCAGVEPKPKKTRVSNPKNAVKPVEKPQRDDAYVESARFHQNTKSSDDPTTCEPATLESGVNESVENVDASLWEVPDIPQPKKKRAPKQRPPDPIVEDLDLEEAVSRRRDWTPPKDKAIASPFTDSIGKENKQIESDANADQFTHMISNFAYAQSPSAQTTTSIAPSTTEVVAITKRRRVELVDLPGNQSNSRNSSPEKGKAPKKKPRTITDRATEQYQPRVADMDPSDVTGDFFQLQPTITKVPLNDTAASNGDIPYKKPSWKRSTSKSDSEKTTSKPRTKRASTKAAAKAKPIAEKLLSPGSALIRMNNQDIMFGTSSQLALEESPTLVRQIQQAIKESEQDAASSLHHLLDSPPPWPRLKRVIGKRSLWDASSRNVEGGLLEHLEDVQIPEFDRTQDFPLLMDGTNDQPNDTLESFVDIDDIEIDPAVVISSDLPTPPPTTSHDPQIVSDTRSRVSSHILEDLVFEDIDDFDSMPPPSNQKAESQGSFTNIDDLLPPPAKSSTSLPPKPRPPAVEPTTGSTQKPPGRRPKPKSSKPATGPSPVAPSKKKPANPKAQPKTFPEPSIPAPKASARFMDIDEILESDDEAMQALSPTPPRICNFTDSQPLPLYSLSPKKTKQANVDPAIVPVHCIPSAQLEWNVLKSTVFVSITAHVRSLPPTSDPSRPSWYEKMLMYDPVVLEDFTAHLNARTRIRSWRRATKAQIKSWNKEMKKTGGEEAFVRENGHEVLAIERDLEAWMVREWCESMSVCCIYGDKKAGGARKGLY